MMAEIQAFVGIAGQSVGLPWIRPMMHYAPLYHTCTCEHHAGLPAVHQHPGRQSDLVPHPGGRVWAAREDSSGVKLRAVSELCS